MHIVNCWWIPRIRMIHGLAYTHYWYVPCLSNNDVVFTPVNCDISASRSCCSASNATKFFNSIDAVILHSCQGPNRMFLGSIPMLYLWTFRHQHHYHSHQHDDDTIAKVHYWNFNVWRNHGSNDKMLWQCSGDIYGRIWWHWSILRQCHWVPWYIFITTSPFLIW